MQSDESAFFWRRVAPVSGPPVVGGILQGTPGGDFGWNNGRGGLGSEVSHVPKSEAPGGTQLGWFDHFFWYLRHPPGIQAGELQASSAELLPA